MKKRFVKIVVMAIVIIIGFFSNSLAAQCFLTANPSVITKGETSTLILTTEKDVTSVTLKPYIKIIGGSLTTQGGNLVVKPDSTITYTVKVSGPRGTSSCSATVNVSTSGLVNGYSPAAVITNGDFSLYAAWNYFKPPIS